MAQVSQIRFQERWLSEQYRCRAYGLIRAEFISEHEDVVGPGKFLEVEEPLSPLTELQVEAIVVHTRVPNIGLFIFCKYGFTRKAATRAMDLDVVLVRSAGTGRTWDPQSYGVEHSDVPVRPGRSLQMTTINPEGARA